METKETHEIQLPPTVGHQTSQCTSLAFETSVVKFQPSPLNSKQMKKRNVSIMTTITGDLAEQFLKHICPTVPF